MRLLPEREHWLFCENGFPDHPFFLRGPNAEEEFPGTLKRWDGGRVNLQDFLAA